MAHSSRSAALRAALHDAEDHLALARAAVRGIRAAQRMVRSTAARSFARRARVRRAIVEHHRDVRAEHALDFHRFLRPEKQQRAVQVRAELDAVRLDLANLRQAEDLEAAAVGQDRPRPS